jgi:ABC-type transport system substrate-binding protein
VLRPAIGSGAEGELFAVAVSPDGRFVVTGGWTGFEWEKANSLYVFETGTGRLVRRIGGHIRLARNPDYWKPGRPYLDGIEYAIIPNRSTAILAFIAG